MYTSAHFRGTHFGVTKWNLKTFNIAGRFLALCASRTEGRFHDLAASCVLLTSDRHLSFHDLARPHCPVFQDVASLAQLIGAVRVRVCARTLSRSHETAESPPARNLKRLPSARQDEDNDAENRVFV